MLFLSTCKKQEQHGILKSRFLYMKLKQVEGVNISTMENKLAQAWCIFRVNIAKITYLSS